MKQRHKNKLRGFIRTHRIGVISAVAVVLVGLYAFWSVNAWTNYTATHERLQTTLRTDMETAVVLPASNVDERTKKVEALRTIAKSINSRSQTICRANGLLRWQEVLPTVKEKRQACDQFVQKVETFETDLQKLLGYLEDETKLTGILAIAGEKKTLSEENLESQTKIWQQAMQDVQSMSASEAFIPVKEVAAQSTKTIYEAWHKLYDAHKAKDAAAYDDARTKIADAYDTLASITGKSAGRFTELTNSVQVAYDATF